MLIRTCIPYVAHVLPKREASVNCINDAFISSCIFVHTHTPSSSDVQRPPVDRSLLIISDQDGGVVGRLPGQLNGRQFKIYDCKNCTILVLDYTSTITVDNCTGCEIFIAPSKGRYNVMTVHVYLQKQKNEITVTCIFVNITRNGSGGGGVHV